MKTKIDYSFIAVPTNLYFSLDTNLRNALTVLLQLSSIYSDSNGYFSISNSDLQEYFRLGKNLTSVVLETLYRNKLISTKIEKTKTKKNVIKYRVNVECFTDWNKLNFKAIRENRQYQIETLDYGKDSNFKVTYTAQTETELIPEPRSVQNQISEEIPSPKAKNVSESLKTPNPEIERLIIEKEQEEIGEMWLEMQKESAPKIEYRTIKQPSNNLNDSVRQKCKDLVERYVEMVIPSANESLEKCNLACHYIYKQWEKGFITEETRKELTKKLIKARFEKHRI